MTNRITWQHFNPASGQGISGTATTHWVYDFARRWPSQKKYANNTGPSYTYTAAGRLASRTWARGLITAYSYNWAGDLSGVNYSDSTSDVTYAYL